MYPGNFDWESEKNAIGSRNQIVRNVRRSSAPCGSDTEKRQSLIESTNAVMAKIVHGSKPISATGM